MPARIVSKPVTGAVAAATLFLSSAAAAEGVSLRSFAAQQVHLAAIADRIGEASANSCEKPRMVTGMLLHDLSGYDPAVRSAVASAFSMRDGVGVLQIVAGSSAERAGLRIDDEILAIGNRSIVDPSAADARKSYARIERVTALLDAALNEGDADLVVRRAGTIMHVTLSAQRGCGGQLALANSGEVNAWSDGDHVMLTTAMMRLAQSDDELAFVIAHEMAHNILGHSRTASAGIFGFSLGLGKARRSELAADRLAVKLMADAGYQPTGSISFLERVRSRFWWNVSLDHPGFGRRIKEVESAMIADADSRRKMWAQTVDAGQAYAFSAGERISSGLTSLNTPRMAPVEFADASAARRWTASRVGRTNCLP